MIMQRLRKVWFLGLLVSILFASGCAWQRIPEQATYTVPSSVPINVGVVLGSTDASQVYGPGVIKQLIDMQLFKSVIYPYREGDSVDGILNMRITGAWKSDGGANFAKGFVIGLSLYTLSAVLGPSMTGIHDAEVTLAKPKNKTVVSSYKIHIETELSWGLRANTAEVGNKADLLQKSKLAVEIADKISRDRQLILKEIQQ